ncbi:MAG: hypothetical protein M1825_004366 [Sarcosagium campestre]|nr:MAG: hypothetical protein M1825_004366 [Sarcosagium campestre]
MPDTVDNPLIGAGLSDDEANGSPDISDIEGHVKGRNSIKGTKRKRHQVDDKGNGSDSDDSDVEDVRKLKTVSLEVTREAGVEDAIRLTSHEPQTNDFTDPQKLKPLTAKQLEASRRVIRKTGVIYLSRVPPFMKPAKVRSLLSRFGPINRIFLSPEEPTAHSARIKAGGNKKRSFTDGWVEFASKKDALAVAESLNASIIGGKKGSYYHDDVWNIRYLKGFKWHHLTEQIANENAERAARLRSEISRTRREDKEFVRNVEKAKMLDGMAKKQREKRARGQGSLRNEKNGEDGSNGAGRAIEPTGGAKHSKGRPQPESYERRYRQTKVTSALASHTDPAEQSDSVRRVLSKVF